MRARGRAARSTPARPFRQREQRRGARPRQSRSPQSAGAAWHLQRQYSYFCTSKASKLKYRRVVAQLPQPEETLEDLGVVRHHTALAHVCAEHRLAALEQLVVQRALRRRQLHPLRRHYLYFRTSKARKLRTCRRRTISVFAGKLKIGAPRMRWSLVRRRQYSASTDRTTCSASACRRGDLEREGSPTNRRNHTYIHQQH